MLAFNEYEKYSSLPSSLLSASNPIPGVANRSIVTISPVDHGKAKSINT